MCEGIDTIRARYRGEWVVFDVVGAVGSFLRLSYESEDGAEFANRVAGIGGVHPDDRERFRELAAKQTGKK